MPSRDSKRNQYGNYHNQGHANGRQGGAPRNHVIPTEPPYTAYIGNAPDSMVQGDFENHLFVGLKVKQVRLVRDRQTDRFRGFAYVDFEDEESLRRAIELDGTCINDRSIRIDVAVRPLGGAQSEGFRNKPGFDSRNGRRQPSGNANNRPHDNRYRQGNYHNQSETSYNAGEEPRIDRNQHSSSKSNRNDEYDQSETQVRKTSNDDVFAAPDTPTSNDEGGDHTANAQHEPTMARQQSRNWADCPIDETTVESSPPPSVDNTFTSDDFHVVRNRNPKSRTNQQGSSRPTGNQYNRDRHNGNNNRGGSAHMSGGRNHYEQTSSRYANNSQPFYHQQQSSQTNYAEGSSYRPNHSNNNNNTNRNQHSAAPRQRLDSNRSNTSRGYNENYGPPRTRTSESSNDMNNNPVSSENRPRLQLLPRSQKPSSATDDKPKAEENTRNASIFGSGKPRDERDPKLAQLNKHIDEVVEKEQHVLQTTPDEAGDVVTKPVRILTAAKNPSVDHENTN